MYFMLFIYDFKFTSSMNIKIRNYTDQYSKMNKGDTGFQLFIFLFFMMLHKNV